MSQKLIVLGFASFSSAALTWKHREKHASSLTDEAAQPQRPLAGRSVAAEEVNGHSWKGDADADQGVDGVAVERHHHQEDGKEAENDGEEQTELWKETRD